MQSNHIYWFCINLLTLICCCETAKYSKKGDERKLALPSAPLEILLRINYSKTRRNDFSRC